MSQKKGPFKFSKKSLAQLATCHPDLQRIAHELIKEMDVSINQGHRGKEAQNKAYANGKSQLKWPKSKHNKMPSLAVDIWPYPVKSWDDLTEWKEMRERIRKIAKRLGIKIRFISWDWPHTELA